MSQESLLVNLNHLLGEDQSVFVHQAIYLTMAAP